MKLNKLNSIVHNIGENKNWKCTRENQLTNCGIMLFSLFGSRMLAVGRLLLTVLLYFVFWQVTLDWQVITGPLYRPFIVD